MNQSEQIGELATALAKAQASLSAAKKGGENPHFKATYATLKDIWDSAREVLAPNDLSVTQTFEATDGRLMSIRTTLLHKSGQWITGVLSLAPQQATPQGIGSAITYGRRYALASILGIVADEDDDGNGASSGDDETHDEDRRNDLPPTPGALNWRSIVVPNYINRYAGSTLGRMSAPDLKYWIENYVPKPYNGVVQHSDKMFRVALDEAKKELIK